MFVKRIGVKHVETIAHQLAVATMHWSEPIPPVKTRRANILESCLAAPFQTYAKRDLYPAVTDKAAVLFYLMVKNHPFQNGNKRLAVTTMLVFLYLNEMWLSVPPQKLYNLAVWVAQSDPDLRDSVIQGLKDFLAKYAQKV